ncbi:hypothetical protein ACIQZI_22575 [Peribacillus sp. NPDC096379]|uniref:hypothetical protein n=1 Tax=Peribacillus sp. NPDC096379 TaxID=3364393 RepID=UPI00381A2678
MTNYYQFTPSIPVVGQQDINPNDQRFFPFLGLGLGFLGGLATGALLAPGPGFGRYPYYPRPCCAPGLGFGGPGYPGIGLGGPGSGFGFAPGLGFGGPGYPGIGLGGPGSGFGFAPGLGFGGPGYPGIGLGGPGSGFGFAPGLGFGGPGLF